MLRLGKVPRNVATLVDLPAKGHRELRCFTPAEAQRFLAAVEAEQQAHVAANSDQACFAAFFIVLLLTGVRPGEALALRWSDLVGNDLRVQRGRASWQPTQLKEQHGPAVHTLGVEIAECLRPDSYNRKQASGYFGYHRHPHC